MKKNLKEDDLILNLQKLPIDSTMRLVSKPLNTKIFIFTTISFYFLKLIGNNEIKYLLLGQIFVMILKYLFNRKRPYKNNLKINNLSQIDEKTRSFPSGHTFTAVLVSSILFKKIKTKNIIFIIFLKLFPYLVAISRVQLGVHYPSDVFFGLFFGKLYDILFFRFY